jgi:hypothetical protein
MHKAFLQTHENQMQDGKHIALAFNISWHIKTNTIIDVIQNAY